MASGRDLYTAAELYEIMHQAVINGYADNILKGLCSCRALDLPWQHYLGKTFEDIGRPHAFAFNQLEGMTTRFNENGSLVDSEIIAAETPTCKTVALRALMAFTTGDFKRLEAQALEMLKAGSTTISSAAGAGEEALTLYSSLVEVLQTMPDEEVEAMKTKIGKGEVDASYKHPITSEQVGTIEAMIASDVRALYKHRQGYSRAVPTEMIDAKSEGGVAAPAPAEAPKDVPLGGRESQVSQSALALASSPPADALSSLNTSADLSQDTGGVRAGVGIADDATEREAIEASNVIDRGEDGQAKAKRARRMVAVGVTAEAPIRRANSADGMYNTALAAAVLRSPPRDKAPTALPKEGPGHG